ncbi:hypothetical protein LX36DRAFT_37527 [Colletotrichum falcatum]|nr:hypothetical protein LX36DRAFT_37527 [Colletotrichum falcatum]
MACKVETSLSSIPTALSTRTPPSSIPSLQKDQRRSQTIAVDSCSSSYKPIRQPMRPGVVPPPGWPG